MPIKIIESDKNLLKYGQSWVGVSLFLKDSLLMPLPSEWTLDMTIQGFSKNTIISYAKTIAIWFKALELNGITWDSVDLGTAQMFVSVLNKNGVNNGTIRLRMVHIQEFYKWALSKKYIARLPYELKRIGYSHGNQSGAPVLKLQQTQNRKVKAQSIGEFEKVLASNPKKSLSLSKRDEIIAEIARYMGLRRSEIANLTQEQFLNLDPSQDLIVIEIVTAKSKGRVDTVLVPNLLLTKILQYIHIERMALVKQIKKNNSAYVEPASLFLNERGKNKGKTINPNYIGDTWKASANKAGVNSRFHDNRSSFATNAAQLARTSGENARAVVRDLLRHKTDASASVYVEFEKMQSDLLMRARLVNDAYQKETDENK